MAHYCMSPDIYYYIKMIGVLGHDLHCKAILARRPGASLITTIYATTLFYIFGNNVHTHWAKHIDYTNFQIYHWQLSQSEYRKLGHDMVIKLK